MKLKTLIATTLLTMVLSFAKAQIVPVGANYPAIHNSVLIDYNLRVAHSGRFNHNLNVDSILNVRKVFIFDPDLSVGTNVLIGKDGDDTIGRVIVGPGLQLVNDTLKFNINGSGLCGDSLLGLKPDGSIAPVTVGPGLKVTSCGLSLSGPGGLWDTTGTTLHPLDTTWFVGIGTTVPQANLTVDGSIYGTFNNFTLAVKNDALLGAYPGALFTYTPNAADLYVNGIYNTGSPVTGFAYTNLNTGETILNNVTSTSAQMQYKPNASLPGSNGFVADAAGITTTTVLTNAGQYIQKWNTAVGGEIMRVTADGLVGINTSNPSANLDVAGNFVSGINNTATNNSAAIGNTNSATGNNSIALNFHSVASGDYSTAIGSFASSTADVAIALGSNTLASGGGSIAIGISDTCAGIGAIGIGYGNKATGDNSISVGYGSTTIGYSSITLGVVDTAGGNFSVATGYNTNAPSYGETSLGIFNTNYTPISTTAFNANDRLLTVGNGTSFNSRSDAMVILKNGNVGIGTSNPTVPLQVDGTFSQEAVNNTEITNISSNGSYAVLSGFDVNTNAGTQWLINSLQAVYYDAQNDINRVVFKGSGNVGIGIDNPTSKLTVAGGDVQVTTIGSGIIIPSPDGTCWRLTIDNAGAPVITSITCP